MGGRGASLDRGPGSLTASPTTPRNISQGNSLELDRPGSRTSINFSYPMNARANSPPQSPVEREFPRSSVDKSPSPPSLSPVETADIQQSVNSAANRKVKLKPKTAAPGSKEGSHFAHQTMGGRPTGTALQDAVEKDEQQSHESASPQSPGTSTTDPATTHPATEDPSQSRPLVPFEDDIAHSPRPKPKKRPSMVMEDHEGEEMAEAAEAAQEDLAVSPKEPSSPQTENINKTKPAREALVIYPPKHNQTAVHPYTRPSPSTSSTPSSPGDRLTVDNSIDGQLPQRQPSVSPNRSARFSAQLIVGSESPLHEPPPRSISPVKPALKSSSSPDRRVYLGQSPSEFSDATSVASDDGSRTGSKRRVAKVSFDDEAEVVGVAASPPTSPEPMNRAQSPVEKIKSRKWYSIGKKKTTSKDVADDDDFESVLRPRPALPSFGSIRGTREPEESAAVAVNGNDSDSSSDDDFDARDFSASSDHAIGGILVNARKNAQPQTQPVAESFAPEPGLKDAPLKFPDEVETLKSTIDVEHLPTVQEESSSATATPSEAAEALPTETPKVALKEETIVEQQVDALKEPVPTIAIQPATPGEEPRNSIDLHNMPGGFPSYIAERVAAPEPIQGTVETPRAANPPVEEADSDGDDSGESIYSDAAEDPDDFQGDVFGSINAIVDSPLPPHTELPKEVPESPTRTFVQPDPLTNLSEPVPSASLEAINPRMPATPSGPTQTPIAASILEPGEQQQQGQQKQVSPPTEPSWPLQSDPAPIAAARVQQRPKAQAADPHQGAHLRKALGKGDTQQPMAKQSLRSASGPDPTSPAVAKTKRTQAASLAQINNNPSRQQAGKTLPHSMTFPAAATKLSANDSDSDSSFKRTRRSSRAGAGGQYSMKRTMRTTRPMSMANSDMGIERTTSPPRASSMRTTMRGPASERSSGFSSLRDKPRPRSSMNPSKIRSRIGDSDDEGKGGRGLFQSRFADSSDEDEPLPSNLTPVRGIPRRKGRYDGESTDLDDSSDEEINRQIRNGTTKSATQMSPGELEAILSQPKKKGLFSRLRSPTRSSGKEGKVRKSLMESPARRDTPLERSRLELAQMRENAASPKLHKRQRAVSAYTDTWPLATGQTSTLAAPATGTTRPSTSDGIAHSQDKDNGRPLFNRHGTSDSIDSRVTSAASEVVVGRSGKKKRFPMLRRAFGLRD